METTSHPEHPPFTDRSIDWPGILRAYREEHITVAPVFDSIDRALQAGIHPSTEGDMLRRIENYIDTLVTHGYLQESERHAAGDVLSNLSAHPNPVVSEERSPFPSEVLSEQEVFEKKMRVQAEYIRTINPELADLMEEALKKHPLTVDNLSLLERWLMELIEKKIITEKQYYLLLDGFTAER